MIPCAWKPQVPPPKAGHSEQLLQAIIITLCDVWPFFSGWTMAAHPGSFSSCCPESCSTRTMDCLSTLPLTATLCKSAHSRPLWRTLMNGQRTCRKYSSETLGFWDHASLIWPLSFNFFSLFFCGKCKCRRNREEVKTPWWVCLGLHALMTLDFRYCFVLFWFYYGQC